MLACLEAMVPCDTPLCPAGHLPLKGGDQPASMTAHSMQHARLAGALPPLISPFLGKMPGRAEGGAAPACPMQGCDL